MRWDEETREKVEVALNEADVLGVRLEPDGAWCDLLVHVLALPPVGPIDPDPRRVLRLTSPGEIRVLLRRDLGSAAGDTIPMRDLDDVEEFFSSITWSGAMYGWRFLDLPSDSEDWPDEVSLAVSVGSGKRSHSIRWFNECGRVEDGQPAAYVIEGSITFEDLIVLRADGSQVPIDEFIEDGRRWWDALHGGDERLSVEAQRVPPVASWRPQVTGPGTGGSAMVPASD